MKRAISESNFQARELRKIQQLRALGTGLQPVRTNANSPHIAPKGEAERNRSIRMAAI